MLDFIASLWSDTTLVGMATGAVVALIGRTHLSLRRDHERLACRVMDLGMRNEELVFDRREEQESWANERIILHSRISELIAQRDGNPVAEYDWEMCSKANNGITLAREELAVREPNPITPRSIKRTLS